MTGSGTASGTGADDRPVEPATVSATSTGSTSVAADSDEPIFHLALPEDWVAAFTTGVYDTSTRGMSLEQVGFIHCSTRSQLVGTANRFYGDLSQLVILTIDPLLVPSPIIFEPAADHGELFPHIFGPLPVAAVNHTVTWTRAADHRWALTDD